MRKRPTTKTLKRKLTERHSLMVRTRDEYSPCISCGQSSRAKTAGHFIPRHTLSTRWHPWNVHGECPKCNDGTPAHLAGYTRSIDKLYGLGALESLARLSRLSWKPLPDQLERLILACDNPNDYESEWFAIQREFAPEISHETTNSAVTHTAGRL